MGQKITEKEIKKEIRSVVRQNIKEVTTNDWHYKAIMAIYDKAGSFTKKKIGTIVCKDPTASRKDIDNQLRDSDYNEITDFTDHLKMENVVNEVSSFIPNVGTIDNYKLKSLLQKNPKVKSILGPNEFKFLTNPNTDVIMVSGKPYNSITTDGKNEFEIDLKKNILVKSLRKARPAIVSHYTNKMNEGEDQIPGGLAKGMTLNDIAEKHGVSVDILVGEFKKGIQTEMEHTSDREMAKEITLDHLFEDPKYYTKLGTIEEYIDDKGVEHVAAALPQTEEEPIKEEDYTETPEETLKGLKEMAMGNLERIADYANMISQRMEGGQNLESWMYSQLTIALENLNTVHDAMDGDDGVKESVKEGVEPDIITQIKDIAKKHQHNTLVDPKSGKKMKVDAFSASAIATVYDALSGSNREKFVSSGLVGMQVMAMKLLK